MIKKVTYICEICGKASEDSDKIKLCEAQHFGLSVEEKEEYNRLCKDVLRWKYQGEKHIFARMFGCTAEDTKEVLEHFQNQLLKFEAKHGIKPEQSQIHLFKMPEHLQK